MEVVTMEERRRDDRNHGGKYRRLSVVLISLLLVLVVGVVGFGLTEAKTEKKAQKTNSKEIKAENKDGKSPEKNPLVLEKYPEVTEAVKDHFAKLSTDKGFIESYDNIQVYTKLGKYKGTYVAFVRYEMKIKDIYTKVPGMETLYVEKEKKGNAYQVSPNTADQKVGDYVAKIVTHADVKNLMSEVETSYQNALQSDALLKEALEDLRNAYEDSTGTSSEE